MKKLRSRLRRNLSPATGSEDSETAREPRLGDTSESAASSTFESFEEPSILTFPDGVEVWHDCPDASVDICFVHGLSGNRTGTWTAHGQSTPWPKRLLPLEFGKARILTYGYDAYVVTKSVASSNRLIDHATNLLTDLTVDRRRCNASSRPLIFVAHSLGGLICKEAILLSRNNPNQYRRDLFASIKGIAFMGTPHKGSWIADWAKIPASALGMVKSTNKSLLKILETDDQFLESIQVRFLAMIREQREAGRQLEVACFFEELPLPRVGKVVSKESATFEGYDPVTILANHKDMVKFSSAEQTGFKRLVGELTLWESEIGQNMPIQETPTATNTGVAEKSLVADSKPCYGPHISVRLHNEFRLDMHAVGSKWTAVYEKWRDDTGKQTPKDYLGGTYFCSFPGPDDTTSIRADVDLEVETYPIKWSITSPDSAYYPGRHEGKVEIPSDYPFKSPWIIWNTPIFSPFVSFGKVGLGHVSTDWNAGQWSPSYTIRNILQSIANFLVYEPFCSRLPQIEGWRLPCLYHPVGILRGLITDRDSALVHSDEFRLVTNFFCRAYNQIDDYRISNPNVEDAEKRQSICAILALQKVFEHLKSRVDMREFMGDLESMEKIEDEDVEADFQVDMTNEEWIMKEQEWANTCSRKYGLGFV